MLKYILYALLIWFLYNLIFRFIIPVYRASRNMRQQFRQMQERMQQQQQQAGQQQQPTEKTSRASGKPASGDYLDFEEIKD
ncbi:MAG: hypothetical protein ACK4E0_06450 [Chitinophagaceae bacterium]